MKTSSETWGGKNNEFKFVKEDQKEDSRSGIVCYRDHNRKRFRKTKHSLMDYRVTAPRRRRALLVGRDTNIEERKIMMWKKHFLLPTLLYIFRLGSRTSPFTAMTMLYTITCLSSTQNLYKQKQDMMFAAFVGRLKNTFDQIFGIHPSLACKLILWICFLLLLTNSCNIYLISFGWLFLSTETIFTEHWSTANRTR